MKKDFQFIIPEKEAFDKDKKAPASYIRKSFTVNTPVKKAVLEMTALGVYKLFVNGMEADKRMLLPGFTNYRKRLQYQTFDITNLLQTGENVIAVILGEGWYRGCLGITSKKGFYGEQIQLAAELRIETETEEFCIRTDPTWLATQEGPIKQNDLKTYEFVDMRQELIQEKNGKILTWTEPGYEPENNPNVNWHSCIPGSYDGVCIPNEGEPVLEQECFSGKILHTPDGNTVVDFGQNLAGHVEFTVTGHAGHHVTLRMGECLDKNGNFTVENLQAEGSEGFGGALGQQLDYILKEGTQTYKSQFLISGYRYVLLENWPEEPKGENFTSIAVHSAMKKTGEFSCSNDLINQFVHNSEWSWKSNSVDIPTDCPTRERAGWAGDINVFSETASFYTDTRKFLHKYLGDFISLQTEEGSLPYIVPEVPFELIPKLDTQKIPYSSAGWADACVHIPLVLYRFYGEKEDIELVYEAAKKYIAYNLKRSAKKNWNHFYKMGKHYKYILDTGFHWGEWLEPGSVMVKDGMKALFSPDSEVATAWMYHTVREVSQMAKILGKKEEQEKYQKLADKIRWAYRKEFLINGTVHSKRQCQYVRPLMMGLVTKEEGKKIAGELNQRIVENHYKIGTGFLTTYQVLFVLCNYGYIDTAYKLLLNEQCPGWLYEVKKGATTTWENWLGIDEEGNVRDSHNHYAPGASVAWLYQYCAGIRPAAPGFKKIRIQPVPGGGLTWAKAAYESVQGQILSSWKIQGNKFSLHVETPKGIDTEIILPNGDKKVTEGGCADLECEL